MLVVTSATGQWLLISDCARCNYGHSVDGDSSSRPAACQAAQPTAIPGGLSPESSQASSAGMHLSTAFVAGGLPPVAPPWTFHTSAAHTSLAGRALLYKECTFVPKLRLKL